MSQDNKTVPNYSVVLSGTTNNIKNDAMIGKCSSYELQGHVCVLTVQV